MQKLISTIITIIFFQTQIFSISAQPTSVLLLVNKSVIKTSVKDKSVLHFKKHSSNGIYINPIVEQVIEARSSSSKNEFTGGVKDSFYNEKGKNEVSNIVSDGKITLVSGGNIESVGTNFIAKDDIIMKAGYTINDKGELVRAKNLDGTDRQSNINLYSATDYEISETKHEEVGGLLDMIDISNMKLDISGGGISLSTSYKESKDKENITSQKAVSNVIQSGNNIILETSKDLISQASQIVADGNIDITTGNNLILTFAEDIVARTKEHSETKITVGVKIGNAYVDVGLAAKNLVDSTKSLNKAKDEYNEMQKKYERGEISKTALEDAKVNLEIATLNVSNATIALATSISGAATSTETLGFYGAGFTNYDTTTTTSKDKTVTQNFGLISSNKDIRLKSGTNLVQEATDITAKETLSYDVGKELSILAGKTTGEQESKREHKTAGISYGNNAVQVSGSYGQDSSSAKTTSYSNSQSIAKDIIIKSEKANISGANIQATNKLEVDIRNNLLLESKQDNYYLKGNGYNIGGSIGIGVNRNGSNSAGVNYGNNKSDSDVKWVNQQTSLTGANSVNILVGNKTDIKGAVIANADVGYDSDGKIAFSNDKGNLIINTKELEYSDIKDKNINESNGFNVGLNIGAGTDKQTASKYPKGSLNIGATASGQERKQQTKATIGNGKIIVDGQDYSSVIPADSHSFVIPAKSLGGNLSEIDTTQSLLGLNRNISTTQELTKSQTTRALNINTTIDLRWLTTSGRKDIFNDLKNAPKNINQIGKNITKNNIIVQSVKNAITDEDINIIEAIKDYIKTDKQIKNIQADKGTIETLNGATNYSVEEVKGALQEVANTSLDGSNAEVTVYNNESGIESKGYSYVGKNETTIIGLNTETTDITNSGDIINTMYHEATHINKGASEKTATNYGDTAQSIWEMYNFGNENTNIITGEQWNEKNRTEIGFIEGNNIALANYNNSILGLGTFNERWIYSQKYGNTYYKNEETGEIKLVASDGYAGKGTGVNNPDMQNVRDVGPLPEGEYMIGDPYDSETGLGPHVLPLTPDGNNEMYGRTDFRIHGDNQFKNNSASKGCIILKLKYRKKISSSGDNVLEVQKGDGIIGTRYTVDMRYNNVTVTDYIDSKIGLSTERYVYITENYFYNLSTRQIDYRNKKIESNIYTGYTMPGLNKYNTQNIPYSKKY